jgi:hypothetical protein
MTYQEALSKVNEFNSEVSSKVYYVCPNPRTDKEGCTDFTNALQQKEYPKFLDPKPYSNNQDYHYIESNY